MKLTSEDQTIKAIADRDTTPGILKSLLETLTHHFDIQVVAMAVHHVEILDPDALPIFKPQLVGPLTDNVQTHVLEHRQYFR